MEGGRGEGEKGKEEEGKNGWDERGGEGRRGKGGGDKVVRKNLQQTQKYTTCIFRLGRQTEQLLTSSLQTFTIPLAIFVRACLAKEPTTAT